MNDRHRQDIERKLGTFEIVDQVTMLWPGWELDQDAWLVQTADGHLHLIMTNHGSAYIADADALRSQISDNEEIVARQRAALQRLVDQK